MVVIYTKQLLNCTQAERTSKVFNDKNKFSLSNSHYVREPRRVIGFHGIRKQKDLIFNRDVEHG